jgi:hypothetical protein
VLEKRKWDVRPDGGMDLQKWDVLKAEWKLYPGEYKIFVGRHANDTTLHASIIIK